MSERIANWLADHGAKSNAISVAGMVCGILGGIIFAMTAGATHPAFFWIAGAVFVQLRLLANLYDGMVAVARGIASPVGELFNEIPDRISDSATLIGFGYAAGSNALLGFVAALAGVFLAYVRAQGKVAGAHQEFCGPMAKQQRIATVTICALACAFLPMAVDYKLPAIALGIIIIGAIVTAVRRLQKIAAALRSK